MIDQLFGFLDYYVPELILLVMMTTLLVAEASVKNEHAPRVKIHIYTQIGLFLTLIALFCNVGEKPLHIFYNAVTIDPFSTFLKIVMVIGTMGAVYLSHSSKDIYSNMKSEFSIMAVGVLIGGMLLASSNNMLTLYLGIEILSILSYVMASLKREDSLSTEAGIKYILYGGLTAGVTLYGISHLYGVFGTIQFVEMIDKVPALEGANLYLVIAASILFFAGLGYKISLFPFHMWTPDVYQGSPIPVTTFFSIVPKLAGIAALVRVSYIFMSGAQAVSVTWVGLLLVVSALTMSVGNISAIGQASVKRMLAFSSIGHVGMIILGVVVMSEIGVKAILFYAVAYMFMTLITFYITSFLNDKYGSDTHDVFKGLIYKHPLMAIIMACTLFSLAGIPPFVGFIAKFNIFAIIIEKKHFGMAIVAAVNSVIALYFYMRLIKVMIFDKADNEAKVDGFTCSNQVILVLLFIPVLFLGIFWNTLMGWAGNAAIFIK